MPDLPKAAVAALDAGFAMHTTTLLGAQQSSDGETTKLLVQLQDGLQVEAVIMEYDNTGGPSTDLRRVSVSSGVLAAALEAWVLPPPGWRECSSVSTRSAPAPCRVPPFSPCMG